ncbi:hypothetical protein DITRI_Ditri03aG0036000 [Diplodiscus trichospermus]
MEQFKGQPRLTKLAIPKRYDLRLKPDLSACKFAGSVSIDIDIVANTQFIVLNAAELSIETSSVSFSPRILAIGFEGVLNDRMKGFYRSEKKNMAVTQFEPADARRCFPCWDEPSCKATFKITLDVPSELVALSNMPVLEEKVNGPLKTVSYQESPIMSTYLVAVVVGLFDYVEDHTPDGIKVRVYCQFGKANQGKFALNVAVRTLELYKDYFAVPYTLPKLDMIAIPDFAGGAMENYGLVTYRETDLLFDELHSAAANKQGVSYLAIDSLFPEWKIWTQFLDESTDGLRLDGFAESHPIEVDINHAAEIDEIFDAISYMKGASVIRMLQSYLGAECFQRSLASYIKKHAYSNVKTENLWAALEEGSGEPVNKLMNTWTKQMGYPVVSVKVKDQKLEFEQSQLFSSGSHGDGQWIVPITFCCGSYDKKKSFLLQTKRRETSDVKDIFSDSNQIGIAHSWIKLNVDQTGFYRVKYDEELAARLHYAIENNYLTASDRFGILDDSFALCMACQLPLTSLLTLMSAYRGELEYTIMSNLIGITYKVGRIAAVQDLKLLGYMDYCLGCWIIDDLKKLGWDAKQGESHLDAMLRGEILTALAMVGHKETLTEASRRFHAFLKNRNTLLLPPDIRKAAYVAVMLKVNSSNREDFESLLRVYRETDLSEEKTRILGSLASCPDQGIVLEVLNFALSSEVRSQDAIYGLAVSKAGREVSWTWFKDNWDLIEKTYGSGFLMTHFIRAIVSPFASFEKVEEVEEFFASRTKASIARTLKQSLERVRINASWVQSIHKEKNLAAALGELVHRKHKDSSLPE